MLADYSYDNLGNRTGVAFGNGASQAYTYDPISRLSQLTNSLTDTNDLTATFSYSPASQIASTTRTGDMYAWTGHGNGSTAYTQNGLNQQATVGGAAASWDSKGNLTTEPQSGKTYGYSSENLLTSASGGVTLAYDPAMRLYQTVGAATTRFLYDGVDAIAEYNGSNALQRRFVFDPTTDQPVLWYEGTGTASTNRRYLSEDERGSVISVSGSTGASLGLNTYDEYGKPGAANLGRFQYTGQKWIGEANLYDYKARDYVPQLGVFAQTDPIGQEDDPNLYAYAGGDPLNRMDPSGLSDTCDPAQVGSCSTIIVSGGGGIGSGALFGQQRLGEGRNIGAWKYHPREQHKKQGHATRKSDSCFTIKYQLGKELNDLGLFLQRFTAVGGTLATIAAAAEGGGLPTALFSIRMYGHASTVRTVGQTLMGNPRATVEYFTEQAIGAMAGADPIGRFVADQAMGVVDKYTSGTDPCKV